MPLVCLKLLPPLSRPLPLSRCQIDALKRQDSSGQLRVAEERVGALQEETKSLRSELARARAREEEGRAAREEERGRAHRAEQVCKWPCSEDTPGN